MCTHLKKRHQQCPQAAEILFCTLVSNDPVPADPVVQTLSGSYKHRTLPTNICTSTLAPGVFSAEQPEGSFKMCNRSSHCSVQKPPGTPIIQKESKVLFIFHKTLHDLSQRLSALWPPVLLQVHTSVLSSLLLELKLIPASGPLTADVLISGMFLPSVASSLSSFSSLSMVPWSAATVR